MSNINNTNKFLEYINTPLTYDTIISLYSSNNIVHEKCALYHDFIQSLIAIIFDTYLGDDVTDEPNRIKHFQWAWNQNISNFNEENIHFKNYDELYQYFLNFFIETFYSIPNKIILPDLYVTSLKLWNYIFNFQPNKTNSDIDILIEVYNLMTKSLK